MTKFLVIAAVLLISGCAYLLDGSKVYSISYAMIALILKPIFVLFIFGGIALPIRWAVNKWMPENKLKHVLLKHRGGKKDALSR